MNLSLSEKRVFRLHFLYSTLEGIVLGVLALNEFVFLKSLKGSNLQVSMVFQFSMVVFIFLIFINELLRRTQNKKRLLRSTALLARLPLMLLFFFPSSMAELNSTNQSFYHILFLGILFVYYLGSLAVFPTINLLLKQNYTHQNFGKMFGIAHAAQKITWVVATFAFGWVLDLDAFHFRYVYAIVAVLGIISVFMLSKIPYKPEENVKTVKKRIWDSVSSSVKRQVEILKTNKPYFHFQLGFMLYGFAFMSTVAVITIFYERGLDLNYSSVAFYKNVYNLVVIALLPLSGKLLGNIDPRKFSAVSFSAFILFFVFMVLTVYFPNSTDLWSYRIIYMLLIANFFYGLFGTTNTLLWHIGSAYFCKPEEAGDYQSVHLSLTGIRAAFAPAIGVLFYELSNFTTTFVIAIVSLCLAIVVNLRSANLYPVQINS